MAKKKVNRVSATRRPRVPYGHQRVELIVPVETATRIDQHCGRNNIPNVDFYKKAIYDALPVHYEVTEEFVFPFGKYAGETASVVKRIDSTYIDWCKKNIPGFIVKLDENETKELVETLDTVDRSYDEHMKFVNMLRVDEKLHVGGRRSDGTRKVYAVRRTPWGQPKFRFLGIRENSIN